MNTPMPLPRGASGSVRANTMNASAAGALVMYRFKPSITHSEPSAVAEVTSELGSDPASGSVSANDATTSPEASRGSHCLRWESVPPITSTCPAMPLLVPNRDRNAGLVYPSSMVSSTCCRTDRPRPPYSDGSAYPYRPISLACAISRAGISSLSSMPASAGITSRRMKSRNSSISSLNSVSLTMSQVSGRTGALSRYASSHLLRRPVRHVIISPEGGEPVPASERASSQGPRRRAFIATATVLAATACTATPKPKPAPETRRFFTPHQAAVVEAATARIAPGPHDDPAEQGHPGAREADVTSYIDTMLGALQDSTKPMIFAGGPYSNRHTSGPDLMARFAALDPVAKIAWRKRLTRWQDQYRQGINDLDKLAGGDFTKASKQKQDKILATASVSTFTSLLFQHTIEGLYGAPEYGGNRAGSGWKEIGFPGDIQPRGYTDDEVERSDGHDPVATTGIIADVVKLLGVV